MTDIWTFHSAGTLVFGSGSVARLGEIAAERGLSKLWVVTDPTLLRSPAGVAVRRTLVMKSLSVGLFDRGEPEPSIALAEEAIAAAREFRPDAVIGLGGGSNMDLAKIVGVALTHGGTVRDYVGENRVPGPLLPVICVPTTAGTGSEVTAASVLTDTERQIKVGVLSNWMRPAVAVVDPLLTLSCPAKVTADSGIDALTHAIEGYTAVDNAAFPLPAGEKTVYQGRHPLAGALAEKAMRLIGRHLAMAVREPTNLAAREGMSLAATLAGLAFSNTGVALVHAMEYPVGGAVHVSHGAGNGLLLPFVMRYNLPLREAEFATIARLLGQETAGLSQGAAAERAIFAVEELKRRIGIPERLRELGVRQEQLPELAAKAFGIKRILRVNPRPVTQQEIEDIYRAAW